MPEKTTKVEIVKPDLPVARFPFENSCNTEVFNGHSLQYIQNDYQSLQEHNCVKYYNYFSIPGWFNR